MRVTQMVQKIKHIIGSGTADKKGVVIFKDFAVDRYVGTYHMLFLGFKLP